MAGFVGRWPGAVGPSGSRTWSGTASVGAGRSGGRLAARCRLARAGRPLGPAVPDAPAARCFSGATVNYGRPAVPAGLKRHISITMEFTSRTISPALPTEQQLALCLGLSSAGTSGVYSQAVPLFSLSIRVLPACSARMALAQIGLARYQLHQPRKSHSQAYYFLLSGQNNKDHAVSTVTGTGTADPYLDG